MSDDTAASGNLTDEHVYSMLRRALRNTLVAGTLLAIVIWIGAGWRSAAMLATGAAISAVSIWEWRRFVRFMNAKLDKRQSAPGAFWAIIFFMFRLTIFAGAIYGSLKCFRGSPLALICGLALALLSTVWEAIGLLRN